MTKQRLAVALEQVEVMARDTNTTPVQLVKGWDKGNNTQREIHAAVLAKYPEGVKDGKDT